jgi:hypothetical protein
MNDRELLELAAKAAGIQGEWSELGQCIVITAPGMSWEHWRPQDDDGDALRLAMRLGFTVEPGRCWHSPYGPAFGEDVLDGYLKSTRRAIVRAAAAIGEAMQ